jgi:hypothetical protein
MVRNDEIMAAETAILFLDPTDASLIFIGRIYTPTPGGDQVGD